MRKNGYTKQEIETMRRMRAESKGYTEVAKAIGRSVDAVGKYCRRHGMGGYRAIDCDPKKSIKILKQRLKDDYEGRWTYVGGYTNAQGSITLRCTDCGTQIEVSVSGMRKETPFICSECGYGEAECEECGDIFTITRYGMKFCCEECAKRSDARFKSRTRRQRVLDNGRVDEDITLTKLIARDKGVCYICGGLVDEEDYTRVNGNYKKVGHNYPSTDHIIPIAKGGTHTWDNVKLAHWHCNILKGAEYGYRPTSTKYLKIVLHTKDKLAEAVL